MNFCLFLFSVIASAFAGIDPDRLCNELLALDCSKITIVDTDETVCATNGNIYNSFCEFDQARCKDKTLQIDSSYGCVTTPHTTKMSTTMKILMTKKTTMPSTTTTPMPTTTRPRPTTTAIPTTTPIPTLDQLQQLFCDNIDIVTCSYDPVKVCATDGKTYQNKFYQMTFKMYIKKMRRENWGQWAKYCCALHRIKPEEFQNLAHNKKHHQRTSLNVCDSCEFAKVQCDNLILQIKHSGPC